MDHSTRSRSRAFRLDPTDGWAGGVCAGLARRLGTDPMFVRIGVVLAALMFPALVILAYAATWILFND